uniref:PX domain-containing protein n=1 Tax=Strigamia maritima TaxID=126957 RepID=T1ISA2_STRMM
MSSPTTSTFVNETSNRDCSSNLSCSPTASRTGSFSSNSTNNKSVSEERGSKASFKKEPNEEYNIPVAGYEIVEERARFTAFKVNIICLKTGRNWTVYRRYSDFSRLWNKLQKQFPCFQFDLPSKRWFGNNFDPVFLESRVSGLQIFINQIMKCKQVYVSSPVRKFFCFDDPTPQKTYMSIQTNWNSLEKYIDHLQQTVKEKDEEINYLRLEVSTLKKELYNLSDAQNSKNEQVEDINSN